MGLDSHVMELIQQAKKKYSEEVYESDSDEVSIEIDNDADSVTRETAESALLGEATTSTHRSVVEEERIAKIEAVFRAQGELAGSARYQVLDELVKRAIDKLGDLGLEIDMRVDLMDSRDIAAELRQMAWAMEAMADAFIARIVPENLAYACLHGCRTVT